MKNKEAMILLSMVLAFSGCSPENIVDESPISSSAAENAVAETGTAARNMKEDVPEMEGKTFIKSKRLI